MVNDVVCFGCTNDRNEVPVVLVCPGWCQTELDRYARADMNESFERTAQRSIFHRLWAYVKKFFIWLMVGWAKLSFQRTALQGAQNLIYAVLSSTNDLEAAGRSDDGADSTEDSGVIALRDGKPEKGIATRVKKVREGLEGVNVAKSVFDFASTLLGQLNGKGKES